MSESKEFEEDYIESVFDRLKDALKVSTYDDLSKALGVGKRQIFSLKKDKQLPLGYIVDLCLRKKININWVFFGEANQITADDVVADGFLKIPYYPDIKASAGGGCVNGECAAQNVKYITIDSTALPSSADKKRLFAAKAVGDSNKTFEQGKIFLLNSYGETLVKRLFRGKTEDGVILKSDNPYYGEEEAPTSAVEILAKVVRFYNGANV